MKGDWKYYFLSEIVDCLDGQRVPIKKEDREANRGEYPYYGASGIIDRYNKYIFDEQLILLGEDGENVVSRNSPLAFKVSGKIWVNNHAHVLKPMNGIDIDFLVNLLESTDYSSIVSGSAQPKINQQNLMKLRFRLPPLPQQKKIAKILSTCDAVIAQTEAAIAKYEAIKKGMMHDLFTRGIDVTTGKLRPSVEDAPELYKESELGMVPVDWEVRKLEEICDITTGSRDTQDRNNKGRYPFFVRSQTIERIDSYSFDGIGILTAGDGVGTGKVFHFIDGKFDFHQRVYLLHNINNCIKPKFLFEFFRTNFIKRVNQYSAKGTVDSVRLEMIAGMLSPIPQKDEQLVAVKILNNLVFKIRQEQMAMSKYQTLKQGLMQDLLTGLVEVSG